MKKVIAQRIEESIEGLKCLLEDGKVQSAIMETVNAMVSAIKRGNKIMMCGNGGSAADAQHVAGEFVCQFQKKRSPLPAIALSTDSSVMTAISNDYSYDDVFARQVAAIGKPGDLLLAISTSGKSRNVLHAVKAANDKNIKTVLLTGAAETEITMLSDIVMNAPSSETPRIQEMHLIIEHLICELVEKAFYE
jgi:D-sedoheptulose 7-phosphate isomerase